MKDFLDDVLSRWGVGKHAGAEPLARGPRWYRRHPTPLLGPENTANKTRPKSGGRLRRFREMRARASRRETRRLTRAATERRNGV